MIEKKSETFQTVLSNADNLLKELKRWNVDYKKTDDGYTFEIQHSNTVYTIEVLILELFTEEEQLFMLNAYPHIKTFADIQTRIFGKVLWK